MSEENVEVVRRRVFLVDYFRDHAEALKAVGLEE